MSYVELPEDILDPTGRRLEMQNEDRDKNAATGPVARGIRLRRTPHR